MFCAALIALALAPTPPAEGPWAIGLEALSRLDLLPAFKRATKIGAVTSYDRTGGNDDGFSGKYSFVRKEGDDLVLADLKGPGCIYRIHTPTPTDDPIEFYFDGEAKPRLSLPFRELFTGKTKPFLKPLVDSAGGGFYSYVPLTFAKSCKVVLRGKHLQFYDLNYTIYPDGAPVKTYDVNGGPEFDRALEKARNAFEPGDVTAINVPAGSSRKTIRFDGSLAPGKSLTLAKIDQPGRIAAIKIGPAAAFSGKDRDVMLRITWDGEKTPAVLCPAGDFFGYAWGVPSTGARLLGTHGDENYCYFPMPFERSAKIELVSLRKWGSPIPVKGEVIFANAPRKPYEGKFYARWRRENPTTNGQPYTFLDTKGRGHLVGLALQAQGMESGNTTFFEGDDQTTIDGELVVHGTGSEDFFNGGWYDVPGRWYGTVARPFSGCMTYQKHLGRTGAYRFMIGDAYSYRQSIRQTIEHGPEKNALPTDYCSVAYFYSEKPPTEPVAIPTATQRRVVDLQKIVFITDWAQPIAAFAFDAATITRHNVPAGDKVVRCLSLRAKDNDFFGKPFISLVCELPAAGRYKLYVDVVKGPEQGKIQMFRDESPVGPEADLFSEKPVEAHGIYLGEFDAREGANEVMLKIVGKDARATAYGLDLARMTCVLVK